MCWEGARLMVDCLGFFRLCTIFVHGAQKFRRIQLIIDFMVLNALVDFMVF